MHGGAQHSLPQVKVGFTSKLLALLSMCVAAWMEEERACHVDRFSDVVHYLKNVTKRVRCEKISLQSATTKIERETRLTSFVCCRFLLACCLSLLLQSIEAKAKR